MSLFFPDDTGDMHDYFPGEFVYWEFSRQTFGKFLMDSERKLVGIRFII